MPLFEFYCADCRSKFEVLTSYEASQEGMMCAACQGQNVRKLLSVFARPARSGGSSDFGDFGDSSDFGSDDSGMGGGGCCGGACGCHN